MSTEVLLLYLATWSLVSITPGPSIMCAMTQATRYGFRHALVGILGIQLGHCVFFGCVACGLVALLAASTAAFSVLRIAGTTYLVYLGLRIIITSFRSKTSPQAAIGLPTPRSLLLQGFAVHVTNPKALLFVSVLLPQFIKPQQPVASQLAIFLLATITIDILVLGAYSYIASRGSQTLRSSGLTVWLERTFGSALVLFGIRLLATRA